MDEDTKGALDRLREAADQRIRAAIHYDDCDTNNPPGFPCDCTAPADVALLLALVAEPALTIPAVTHTRFLPAWGGVLGMSD